MRDVDPDLTPDDVTDRVAVGGRGRFQSGAVLGGRYQVHEFLGRNAVGEQYRALELKADRPVALRVLSPGMLEDAAAAQRLRLEVDHAKTLSHKNIATIYGMG